MTDHMRMGPLADGAHVAIIGGGPGGMACALAIMREAARLGRKVQVTVFEGKRFDADYNQCSGVLSPPLLSLLANTFEITLPPAMLQREIQGYALHTDHRTLVLNGSEYGGVTYSVRRSEFDLYLAQCARERGVTIIPTRVTDLEFRRDEVVIFTWSGTYRADVVVGAFGLSRAMTTTLARRTAYRPPRTLETVITKVHPVAHGERFLPNLLDNYIHVLLPPLPGVEFGALIPKGNHITIIVAGERLRTDDMDALLALPALQRLLPGTITPENYYKGRFPISLARGICGDRYVTVGDAAGLVRPFKGKGINSAIITGDLAGRTIMEHGVSREAFQAFLAGCRDITGDLWYGQLMRTLAGITSHYLSLDPVLRIAENDPALRNLLFACVSGSDCYRRIVLCPGNLRLALRLGLAAALGRLRPER